MEIVDKISEKAIEWLTEYILSLVKESKKNNLWEKSVRKACEATEGVDDSLADYIIKLPTIQRHFLWIISNKSLDNIYYSFIITIAVELCTFNIEKRYAVSLGMAILDNWFEMNGVNYQDIDIRNPIIGNKISDIVNNRERLYREYFLLYNDPIAKDIIRVYYPKNGESWISWNKEYSIDIKVNLSKGTEYGFCRIGFSYCRIDERDSTKFLKVAYVNEDREIYRFENDDMIGIDDKKILWVN